MYPIPYQGEGGVWGGVFLPPPDEHPNEMVVKRISGGGRRHPNGERLAEPGP